MPYFQNLLHGNSNSIKISSIKIHIFRLKCPGKLIFYVKNNTIYVQRVFYLFWSVKVPKTKYWGNISHRNFI